VGDGQTGSRDALNRAVVEAARDGRAHDLLRISSLLAELTRGEAPHRADWEASLLSLLAGEFRTGWVQYESRLRLPDFIGQTSLLSAPRWDGRPYRGRTLLVHGEQGFGDTIMMLRYIRMAKALGGTLLVFVQPPLGPLAATCIGPDLVFDDIKSGPIGFNYQLPMMSLPFVLGIDPSTAVSGEPCPYLRVPVEVPNGARIDAHVSIAEGRKIGLVWAGRPTHKRDRERSMPHELLAPLGDVPGTTWFTLQREEPELLPFPGAVPLGGLLDTFADTAHAISGMDLLVTVDTCAAHLAGALGIPVMLLVTCLPDWRWQLVRTDSPWYPATRVFRQKQPGDWKGVVEEVVLELTNR
jgi:hypothetical protein